MAKFEVGHKKVGGRAKEKENKTKKKTSVLLEILEEEDYDPARDLVKRLKDPDSDLLDKERCDLNLKLMDFIHAKRRAVDEKGESSMGELTNLIGELNGSNRPGDEE